MSNETKFFILLGAVVIILGIIFAFVNMRAANRNKEVRKKQRRGPRPVTRTIDAPHSDYDLDEASDKRKFYSVADQAYRDALRRNVKGEELSPVLLKPSSTSDQMYRDAMRNMVTPQASTAHEQTEKSANDTGKSEGAPGSTNRSEAPSEDSKATKRAEEASVASSKGEHSDEKENM